MAEKRHSGPFLWIESAESLVVRAESVMSGKRPMKEGSFGGHFEELVKHFPHSAPRDAPTEEERRNLREKRDIHALLFEQAWKVDRQDDKAR